MKLIPVTLPPGRLRLATSPTRTGSPPVTKTIGTVVVAALAASAAGVLPTIRATCRRRSPPPEAATGQFDPPPAVLDRDVLALDEACFLQALAECSHAVRLAGERSTAEKPHHRHRRLLRARRERPRRRRAAEQRDELAPLSFNHLVGALLDMQRYVESERFRGLEIDD